MVGMIFREFGIDVNRHLDSAYMPALDLPHGASDWLHPENPLLLDLRQRYEGHPATDHRMWTREFVRNNVQLRGFRADNAYIWQQRELMADIKYVLTACYVREHDSGGLLSQLGEDGAFGAYCICFDDRMIVSRDLLDSIMEIRFLCDTLKLHEIAQPSVLDIGAGYGRLAHRLLGALPTLSHVMCTDAVPESTFISQYYLKYRGLEDRASAVPLTEIENRLSDRPVTVATNVHSFSECGLAAIEWWLDRLAEHDIRYLMLVPNGTKCDGERLYSFDREDYFPALTKRGYRLAELRPKYHHSASVQRFALSPTYHYLFERTG